MNRIKDIFHRISYVQYPLMLVTLGYTIVPYVQGFEVFWQSMNQALIFAGLAISFSTLQDTSKTQNDFSRKIWEDPVKGKRALLVIALSAFVVLLFGLYGFYVAESGIVKEVSFGAMMFGVGYMGLLKSAVEMFENHRNDRMEENT